MTELTSAAQQQAPREGNDMEYFVYRLIPPRPDFDSTMSEREAAAMEGHFSYWQGLIDGGDVLVYGPVGDPAGTWGLAVLRARSADAVQAIGQRDPAVTSGVARFEVLPMLVAMVKQERAAA
jgi:uncharacterized protein